jgi:hypothetical protein
MKVEPTLSELLAELPANFRESLAVFVNELSDIDRAGSSWHKLKDGSVVPPGARASLQYWMIGPPAHASVVLAFVLRLSATAFSHTADAKLKISICTSALEFITRYIAFLVTSDPAVEAMLHQIIAEVRNVAEGNETTFLKHKRQRRRPSKPQQEITIFCHAAVMIDILVEKGNSELKSAREIARYLRHRGWLPMAGLSETSAAQRLLNWRARIRASRRSPRRSLYEHIKDRSRSPDGLQQVKADLERIATKVQ